MGNHEYWLLLTGFIVLLILIHYKGFQWVLEYLALFYISNTIIYVIARKLRNAREEEI